MIVKQDIQTFSEKHRILLRTNEFICLLPHPKLRQYISNYNITFPTKVIMPDSFTEMPCGCATLTIENNHQRLAAKLEGPTTKPILVGNQANQLELLITIEFKPAGLYALTGINQYELTDEVISFDAVNPKLSKLVCETIEKAGSADELIANLDILLLENMYTAYHPQFIFILQNIVSYTGNTNIKKLSAEIHYSERQLNRIFHQHVGMSAKSFSRLVRINNSFRLLKKADNSLTLVSDLMGFHDLSHFTRDFKSVCEITPQEYRKNMSDFYINTKKF